MLFKLLLPYFCFSLDSLDFLSPFGRTIFSRAQRVGDDIPRIRVNPCSSVGGIISAEAPYRSARIGLWRKSSYAMRMPSSSSVVYVQPSLVALLTSKSLRGVPLGRVVSHSM